MDVDNLENCSDFVHSVKRGKVNADPCATPVKRRRISKKDLIDAARADEEEKAKEQAVAKKQKAIKSAKAFISDEAEEDDAEDDAHDGRIIAPSHITFFFGRRRISER